MRPFGIAYRVAAAAIGIAILSGGAAAKDLHLTASVGETIRIYGHVRFAKGCAPGAVPDLAMVVEPKLGKLSTKVEPVTLTAPDFGSCPAGLSGPGRVVYYTAIAGGRDSFHYRMSSAGLPTTDWTVTVDIR
jgi:hypothetical protein